MENPNLGTSREDAKKLESYFRSTINTPPTDRGVSQNTPDAYFDTHSPDIEITEKYFTEPSGLFVNMTQEEIKDFKEDVNKNPNGLSLLEGGALSLVNITASLTMNGFSFKVIKEENGNPKIIIKVREDIKDLTVEVKTGGRIIGVNTFVNTSE